RGPPHTFLATSSSSGSAERPLGGPLGTPPVGVAALAFGAFGALGCLGFIPPGIGSGSFFGSIPPALAIGAFIPRSCGFLSLLPSFSFGWLAPCSPIRGRRAAVCWSSFLGGFIPDIGFIPPFGSGLAFGSIGAFSFFCWSELLSWFFSFLSLAP